MNCWPMNMAPINDPKTMMPPQRRDPEGAATGDVKVVEGVRGATLAHDEGGRRDDRDGRQHQSQDAGVGDRREVDGQDQRRHQDDRQHPAEVVDRVGRLVHMAGHVDQRHHQGDRRQRHGEDEDRAPPVVLQQRPGDHRTERGHGAADAGPESDGPGAGHPGPQRRDQREGGGVGHAAPRAHPGAVRRSGPRSTARRRPADRPAPTAPCPERAGACVRAGRPGRRGRAPTRPGRASSRPRSGRAPSARR